PRAELPPGYYECVMHGRSIQSERIARKWIVLRRGALGLGLEQLDEREFAVGERDSDQVDRRRSVVGRDRIAACDLRSDSAATRVEPYRVGDPFEELTRRDAGRARKEQCEIRVRERERTIFASDLKANDVGEVDQLAPRFSPE